MADKTILTSQPNRLLFQSQIQYQQQVRLVVIGIENKANEFIALQYNITAKY
jgi:hypothetical protein